MIRGSLISDVIGKLVKIWHMLKYLLMWSRLPMSSCHVHPQMNSFDNVLKE